MFYITLQLNLLKKRMMPKALQRRIQQLLSTGIHSRKAPIGKLEGILQQLSYRSFSFTEPGPPPEKPSEGAERIGDKIPMEEFLQKVMKKGD